MSDSGDSKQPSDKVVKQARSKFDNAMGQYRSRQAYSEQHQVAGFEPRTISAMDPYNGWDAQMIHQKVNALQTDGMHAIAAEWGAIGRDLHDSVYQMGQDAKKAIDGQWTGAAAEAALGGIATHAADADRLGDDFDMIKIKAETTAIAIDSTKPAIPDPALLGSPPDPLALDGIAFKQWNDAQTAATTQARLAMSNVYAPAMYESDISVPRIAQPTDPVQAVTPPAAPAANSGGGPGATLGGSIPGTVGGSDGAGGSGGGGAPGADSASSAGSVGSVHDGGASGSDVGGSTAGGGSAPGSSSAPGSMPGARSYGQPVSTQAAGLDTGALSGGSAGVGGGGLGGLTAGGGGSIGGGAGGFGGDAGGLGGPVMTPLSGSGSGVAGGAGGGNAAGRAGAAGATPSSVGNATGARASRTSMGAAPHGSRGGGEDDDEEYRPASYLVSIDNGNKLIGKLPRVVPPVIGG